EVDLPVLPDQLLRLARLPEHELIDLGLPVAEARTGERAERAAPVTVRTGIRTVLLELDGPVVLVGEDVERTRDDARGAPGAQAARDDLVVQLAPLGRVGLGHRRRISRR